MAALAATLDRTPATFASGKSRRSPVAVGTHSLQRGRPAVVPTPEVEITRPWAEALSGFRLSLQAQHRSDGTIRNRLCTSTIMAKHAIAAGLEPADADYGWLARYVSAQFAARKGGGSCSLYADLRAFWTWYSAEYQSDSPMVKIPRPREVLADVPVLSQAQIDALLTATDSGASGTAVPEAARNRAIVLVLLDSGLRRMELSALDCTDVDLEDPPSIRVRRGKGGKARTVLISTVTAQAIWRYLRTRTDSDEDALFLSAYGSRLTPSGVG
jgi:integrase